jgi:hypothetical protein
VTGSRRSVAVLLLSALFWAPALAEEGADPRGPEPRAELMERIAREEGLETRRSASVSAYAGHVFETLVQRAWLGISDSPALRRTSRIVIWGVALLALALLAWAIAVPLYRIWQRRITAPAEVPTSERELPRAVDPRREFAQASERGDAPGALRALWRWVVASLAERGTVPARGGATHREILDRVRRREPGWEGLTGLRELTRRSERWLYRGEPFDVDEVGAMRERLGSWLR